MKVNPDDSHLLIKGITESGNSFRPSDWAERMCGALCTFRNRRMYYSPLLRPAVVDGIKSVIMYRSLETQHPDLYRQLLEFAKTNKLQMETLEGATEKA